MGWHGVAKPSRLARVHAKQAAESSHVSSSQLTRETISEVSAGIHAKQAAESKRLPHSSISEMVAAEARGSIRRLSG
jgi:hypothetical protein